MLDYEIHGGKGGGDKPHTPVETPNNLLSVAYAKVLIAVAEGELAGVPTNQDIFLDGTPLANPDGSLNFGGVKWEWRSGTQDQTYIQGLPEVSTEYNVGVELKSTTPWVRNITKTELDGVRVTFQWPALLEQKSNGDTVGVSMDYKIQLSKDGGAFTDYKTYTISGKTNTTYERTHRIDLPKATTGWIIRAVKLTADTTSGTIQDTMTVKSVAEVVDVKQRYPNTALLYVEFDSRMFGGGSIPKVSVRTKGRVIRVPDNYDPVARTYSGVWSGAFKWAWSDNPAWVYHDIITQDRFGLGNKVSLNMVDKWALYEISQHCDVMVDNGYNVGVLQPRHTCNIYIQEKRDAWQVLRDIASIFNGMTYWNGNQFTAIADKQEPFNNAPVFSRSNVINGRFDYAAADDKSIYTSALVSYDEPENHYNTAVESTFETEQILRWGGDRQIEISAIGCTSRGEAQRRGKYALITNMYNRTVSFRTGLQGLNDEVMPGKLIHVVDPLIGGRPFTGRIKAAVGTVLTLDRTVDAVAGDIMYITKSDGVSEGRTISAVAGNIVTLQVAYTELPKPNAVWYLEAADLKSQLFRVTKITSPEESVYEIEGVEYNDSKYAAVDTGARLEPRPISVVPPNIQQPPTNVNIISQTYVEQMMSVNTMVISWNQTQNAVGYEVQWKVENGDWVNAGTTGALSVTVKGIYTGQYVARVRAINAFDIKSIWVSSALTTLNGKVGLPPALTSLSVEPLVFGMKLNWTFPVGAEDTARTEIMYSPTQFFASATKLGDFAYPQTSHSINGLKAGQTFYFWGRLVDRTGNIGPYFPLTTQNGVMGLSSTDVAEYEEYFIDMINESALGQQLGAKIDKIEIIEADLDLVEIDLDLVKTDVDQIKTDVVQLEVEFDTAIDKVNTNVNWIESQIAGVELQLKNDLVITQGELQTNLDELQVDLEAVDQILADALVTTKKDVDDIKEDVVGLNTTIDTLQDQVDGITDALEYNPNRTYAAGEATRVGNNLYQATQSVPLDTSPPNATYWKNVGEVITAYDALASQVSTNTTNITQQGNTLTTQAGQLTALTTRVNTAEGNITGNSTAITNLQTTVTTQGNSITSQGSLITGLRSDVTSLQTGQSGNASAITSLTTRVTTAEGTITSQGQSITSLNATVGTLQTDLNGVESTVLGQGTAINGLTTTVTQQGNTLTSHGTSITALENSVSDIQTDVSGLTTTVTGQGTSITNLQNTVTQQGNTITAQAQDITTLKSDVLIDKTDISGLKTTTTAQGTAITNLQTTVTSQGNSITSNSNSITNLTSDLHFNELDALYEGNETDAQIADALVISKATASATESLTTTVTSHEGIITAQGQSITDLKAALEDSDGNIVGQASAIESLKTSVTQQGNTINSQGASITSLDNSLATTNTNVDAAQQAATDANTLAGGKGKVFFQASAPAVGEQLSQNLWIDTTGNANTPKRWNGSAWVAVTDKVATDAATAAANALTQVATKADASAVTALTTRVTNAEGTITSQGTSITSLNNSLTVTNTNVTAAQNAAQAASDLAGIKGEVIYGSTAPTTAQRLPQNLWIDTTSGANTPKRWLTNAWVVVTDKVATDAAAAAASALTQVATKAEASAVTSLTTRVTSAEGTITSQGTSITNLNNSLTTTNTNVSAAQTAAQAASDLAGTKGKVLVQTTTPVTADQLPQNLWIDITSSNNTPKRWNGSAWVVVTDKVATDAAAAAANALSVANTKADASALNALTTRVTSVEGVTTSQGSSITTLTNNLSTTNTNVTAAQAAADAANTLAGGKGKVFYGSTAPATAERLSQNLWIDTTGGSNTPKRWDGSAWTAVTDKVATDAAIAAANALSVANTKADASAVTALTSRVTTAEGSISSQGTSITTLNNSLTTTNNNVTAAQAAAQAASDQAGAKGEVIYGSTAPAVEKRLPQNLWIDTTGNANTPKRWLTNAWVVVTDKVATDAATAAANALAQVALKADSTALTALTNTVTQQGTDISANAGNITILNTEVHFQELDELYAGNETDAQIADALMIAKGTASANESLTSEVTQQGDLIKAQAESITDLASSLSSVDGDVSAQGVAIENLKTVTTAQGNTINSQSTSLTSLTNSLTVTNTNVTAAQTAADAANTLAGGKGKVIVQNAAPDVADRLAQNLWIDTTSGANTPKRWLTSAWVAVTDKVATDAAAAAASALSQVATKAEASALTSLTTRVTSAEGTITTQGQSITTLNNSLTTTNTNVTAAQAAADAANTLAGGKGKVIVQTAAPAVGDRLAQNLWIDITGNANTPKRWDGSAWTAVTDKVATDAAAAAANALSVANTKADASAVTALTSRVTTVEGTVTTQGQSITTLNNSLTTTNTNVTTAQAAADAANTLAGGKGKVMVQSAAPAVGDRLAQNLWIDTTGNANTPKRWDGSNWTAVTDKVATDAAAAAANALSVANTKADSSAVSSLTTRVTTAEGLITSQGSSITSLNNSLTTTNTNVTTAQNAAQAASDLAGSKGKVFYQTAEPAVGERLSQNLWIDITGAANTPKRWNGSAWAAVTDKVATDAATAAASALTQVATKADASALTALTNTVTSQGTSITTNASNITLLNTDVHFQELDELYVGNETDAQIADALMIANGAASANESLTAEVTQQGDLLTAQAVMITDLSSELSNVDGDVVAQGTAIENLKTVTTAQGNTINSHGVSITSLTNRVTSAEGNITGQATALSALDTRVTSTEGTVTSQGTSITSLTSSLATTNTNVTTAQNAANAANTLAGGKGKVLVQTTTPVTADQLVQNLWIDITGSANTPKRWNGSAWVAVTDKVATDAAAAAANALSVANTKADAGAVTTLTTRVTNAENSITASATKLDGVYAQVNPTLAGDDVGLAGSDSYMVGVWSETSARIEDGVVLGSRVDTVQVSSDQALTLAEANTAAVQQVSQAQVDADGRASAMWSVKLQVNQFGQYVTAGIGLGIENGPAGLQSTFLVNADTFAITNGVDANLSAPFVVNGGQVFIKDAFIANGSITMLKIGDTLQSDDFVAGIQGWRLTKAGTFEINGHVPGQGTMVMTNRSLRVYDVNNVKRVQLGDLSE